MAGRITERSTRSFAAPVIRAASRPMVRSSAGAPTARAGKSSSRRIFQVSAGARYTCGVLVDLTVVCWGDNSSGQSTPPLCPVDPDAGPADAAGESGELADGAAADDAAEAGGPPEGGAGIDSAGNLMEPDSALRAVRGSDEGCGASAAPAFQLTGFVAK